jgi:ParB family chromosome partitioning protein
MVDSNIQRENILPSERAFAYKLKLDAIRRQAGRPSNNSRQVVGNLESAAIVGKDSGESGRQVQRFIRLTELVPELLDMVDAKKIAFNPAVELSYLMPHEQVQLMEAMDMEQSTPSLSQAQRLKKYSQDGKLTFDVMTAIMSEDKKGELDKVTLTGEKLKKYFPKSYTPQQMEETILKLLEGWSRKRQQSQER